MIRLTITDRAIADLFEILDYIQEQNAAAATDMDDRFWREFDFLCDFPGAGHSRSDVQDVRYRFRCIKSYVICYRVDGSDLRILRVLHGARDFRHIEFE